MACRASSPQPIGAYAHSIASRGLASLAAAASLAPGAAAQAPSEGLPHTVIFSERDGAASNSPPGTFGVRIDSIGRPSGSPNGNWIVVVSTDLPPERDQFVVANGFIVASEGSSPAYVQAGECLGYLGPQAAITDEGDLAFMAGIRLPEDLPTSLVLRRHGQASELVAREGTPVPGAAAGIACGRIAGFALDRVGVTYISRGTLGLSPLPVDAVLRNGELLHAAGTSGPFNQAGGATRNWRTFRSGGLSSCSNGSRHLVLGELQGAAHDDLVLARDGSTVVQEGAPLCQVPSSGLVDEFGIESASMGAAGSWVARGEYHGSNEHWVVLDGGVVSVEGSPIVTGASEHFAGGYFLGACNGRGDHVVGGWTDLPDERRNAVIVLGGERILLREGDAIDLDGNGAFDDDLYIGSFRVDDGYLTDERALLLVVRGVDQTGREQGDVFLRVEIDGEIGSPVCAAVPNSTGVAASTSAWGGPRIAVDDIELRTEHLPQGSFGYYVTSPSRYLVPGAGGGMGTLCIASPSLGRYADVPLVASAAGVVTMALDLSAPVPSATGPTFLVAGETRHWQYWHRDLDPTGQATSNFCDGVGIIFQP